MLIIKPICKENSCKIILERPFGVLLITKGEGRICVNKEWANLRTSRVFFLKEAAELSFEGELLIAQLLEFPEVMFHAFLIQFVMHRDRGLYNSNKVLPFLDLDWGSQQFFMSMSVRLEEELERETSAFIFKYTLFVLLRRINWDVEKQSMMSPYKEKLFTRLMDLIASHYKESRKTRFYASKLGIEDEELLDFSREVFKKKFFDVIMERLVIEADLLLINSALSIQEIAYELGFGSPSQFAMYYLRYKCCSPTEFRRKWGK